MNTGHNRRGVLLLVVLSVLTLFLMLGASYLAVASRARKAARAFANNVVAGTASGMAQERLLDEAFLSVARGTTASKQSGNPVPVPVPFIGSGINGGNDLLGDKYGPSTAKGRITTATKASGSPAVLQLTCSITSGSVATGVSDYPGRVVTLSLPGLSASTRIIGATGAADAPTLFIASGPTITGETLSDSRINTAIAKVASASATTLIINGREFDDSGENEPYDGYDIENPLLTRSGPSLATTGTAAINSGAALEVDNDGDGVPDSGFIDIGLPPVLGANGNLVFPRAAILVLDLDGRLNVNAHGSATDAQTVGGYPTLNPLSPRAVPLYQLPRGFASGPADVSLSRSLVFSDTATLTGTAALRGTAAELKMVEDAARAIAGITPSGTDALSSREVPRIGAVEGRLGDGTTNGLSSLISGAVGAGQPSVNDAVSREADKWRASADASVQSKAFGTDPGRFGSPWDVKGRMRIWADEFGQPVYFKPSWPAGINDELTDDPYEVNLTRLGSRAAYTQTPPGAIPADNLYTPAELEGLLRYYDPDSLKLPRRLVAISGSNASANRLRLTTESWDTTAIPGSVWRTVIGAPFEALLTNSTLSFPSRPYDKFSPETIMGHKFDINRPFHDTQYDEPNDTTGTARRQTFARQLYCLMVSIARSNGVSVTSDVARQIAQYAVNVVDYRDGDSVMTRFEYDPAFAPPGNATWSPGPTDYVWGCERPELLMTEVLAWHDRRTDDESVGNKVVDTSNPDNDFDQSRRPWAAFFVELYSPWKSRTAAASGSTSVIRTGTGTRGDPIPGSLRQSGTFEANVADGAAVADSTITLNKTVNGFPVWRLVSVLGDVQGGTGINTTTKNLVDPSAPASSAVVDRVFYFGNLTGSGTALLNPSSPNDGKPGAVFWTTGSAAVEPSQSNYVVVGTAGLGFQFTRSAATPTAPGQLELNNTVHLQFDQPALTANDRLPATLSERLSTAPATDASKDPYEVLATQIDGGNQNKFTPDNSATPQFYEPTRKLQRPTDQPLDMATGVAGISPPLLTRSGGLLPAGQPLVMFNGTHENFAIIHLQRLADPGKPWSSATNPYVTVDSMPVDITVLNTNSAGTNHDEPGLTGQTPLSWLTTQKAYRFKSIQRGGQSLNGTTERDIWSRRVNESATELASGTTAISGTSPYLTTPLSTRASGASAINLTPPNPMLLPSTTPVLTGTTDHTLRERVAQTERDSRPVRFEKGAGKPPLFPWLAWPNQPFGSVIDLALVPVTSPFDLSGRHSTNASGSPSPKWFHLPRFFEATTPESPWDALAGRTAASRASIFDFVHVPSPYAALYTTVEPTTTGSAALATLGLDVFPINQISNFREPGRVNVNTIPDRRVWRALFGAINAKGVSVTDPVNPDDPFLAPAGEADARDRLPGWTVGLFSYPSTPAQHIVNFFRAIPNRGNAGPRPQPADGGFLDEFGNEDANANDTLDAGEDSNGNGVLDNWHRDTNLHAYFRYQTMRQLSNVTTTRSHVFGVWITIAYMDGPNSSNEVQPIARNRAFFIFDRSIPVAYEQGKDHNVRDAILLRRIIQ